MRHLRLMTAKVVFVYLAVPPPKKENFIFKPAGVTGSYPIRSIVESSCPLAPPPWIRTSIKEAIAK
jgi:hypothetical protein